MAQITIYLADDILNKVRQEAKSKHISQSKWIAEVLIEKLRDTWPSSVVALAGFWKDAQISAADADAGDIDLDKDIPREKL